MRHGLSLSSARAQIVELANERTTKIGVNRVEAVTIEGPPHLEIRIAPTDPLAEAGSFISAGSTFWLAHGFTFRGLIAQLYQIEESRVDCPPTDNARYDCTVVVPRADEPDAIRALVREAIERFFSVGVMVTSETDGVRVSLVPAR